MALRVACRRMAPAACRVAEQTKGATCFMSTDAGTEKKENTISTHKIADLLNLKGPQVGNSFWCSTGDLVIDAVHMMVANNVGALLVFDFGEEATDRKRKMADINYQAVAGIISERDYMKKIIVDGRSSQLTKVGEIMTRQTNLITVTPETPMIQAMELMVENHIRHIPVVDSGKMAGLVSIRDVVRIVVQDHREEVDRLREFISGGYMRRRTSSTMRARTRHELDLDVYIRRRKELLRRLKGPGDADADEEKQKRPDGKAEARGEGGEAGRWERRLDALEEQVRMLTQQLHELTYLSKKEQEERDQVETDDKKKAFPNGVEARPPASRNLEGPDEANAEKPGPSEEQRIPFATPTKKKETDPAPYFRKTKVASPPSFHMTEHEKTPLPPPKKKEEGSTANMEKVNSREDAVISRKTPVMASRSAPKMSELEYPPDDAPAQPPKQKKVLKKREPFDMKAKRLKSLKKQADWDRKWDRNGAMQRHKTTKWVVHNEDI